MSRSPGILRLLLPGMSLVSLLSGCQSIPADVSISSESSLLAVEVRFPIPFRRDPHLVQAFLVRGPIHGELKEFPELVPASFVKNSRAYLLDPEPGTYSLVAVTSAVAAPLADDPVAGGVTRTTLPGTIADAMILPAPLIRRTRTTIAPGSVAFMGTLRVRPGDRINADTVFQEDLQRRIAERVHPGATARSGLAGWFTRTWTVDLEKTSYSSAAADRESLFDAALTDLGDSPWGQFVARAAAPEAAPATPSPPAPRPTGPAPIPQAVVGKPPSADPEAKPAISEPENASVELESAVPEAKPEISEPESVAVEAEALAPSPERRPSPGVPPGSPLAAIEIGMSFDEVREILGDPDEKIDRLTARAWIPFYSGRGAHLREWIYHGEGRVVFSLHKASLEVLDVVYDPNPGK